MSRKKIYSENDRLFCLDNNGKAKKLNFASRVHRIIDDFIINGYEIEFSDNSMILKSGKKELEIVDYINLLDNKLLAFLNYDIYKNMATNNLVNPNAKNKMMLYSDGNNLLFSSFGIARKLDKKSKVHTALDEIVSHEYNVGFNDDNMILFSKNSQLVIKDYMNLLDIDALSFLDYDIRRKIALNGYSDVSGRNKKKLPKYFFRSAACFSLIFSMIYNGIIMNASGISKKKYLDDKKPNTSTLENDYDFDYRDFEELSDFFMKNNFLVGNFNGNTILSNKDNSDYPRDNKNDKVEPLYSDEEIENIYSFIDYNYLSLEKFVSLIEIMTSDEGPFGALYSTKEDAIKAIAQGDISYQVKFLTIMIREENTYAEVDKMCAGVCGEATGDGNCYEDAYAVASTLVNRTHKDSYVYKYGQRLYDQFCAPGQYEVDISGNYIRFLGQIDLEGYHAALDAFYTRESMHKYIEFRANWVDLNSYEMFVPGGNKFIAKMKDSQYVPYPDEELDLDDVKVLVLERTND